MAIRLRQQQLLPANRAGRGIEADGVLLVVGFGQRVGSSIRLDHGTLTPANLHAPQFLRARPPATCRSSPWMSYTLLPSFGRNRVQIAAAVVSAARIAYGGTERARSGHDAMAATSEHVTCGGVKVT